MKKLEDLSYIELASELRTVMENLLKLEITRDALTVEFRKRLEK